MRDKFLFETALEEEIKAATGDRDSVDKLGAALTEKYENFLISIALCCENPEEIEKLLDRMKASVKFKYEAMKEYNA